MILPGWFIGICVLAVLACGCWHIVDAFRTVARDRLDDFRD